MQTKPRRTATPARWQAALTRAFLQQIQVRQVAGSGVWVATSATDPSVAYATDGQDCECQAAQNGDPVCKHRAMFWFLQGALEVEQADVVAAAVAEIDTEIALETVADIVAFLNPSPTVCPTCQGSKQVKEAGFDGPTIVPCWTCTRKAA